ncbi:MAG: BON domain-containing protein [Rhodopirellula sp.]|nr:BON domain-containing protein [Rhodopirellula sp.]
MTLHPAQRLLTRCQLRAAVALAFVTAAPALFSASAQAQTSAASRTTTSTTSPSTTSGATATGNTASAAQAGSILSSQNNFSSTSSGIGATGANAGRFAGSTLATQPTAGATNTTTTQQNALDQARNLQRLSQQFNRANQNRGGNTQSTRTIRSSLRLGFTPKARPTEDLREALGKQLQALKTRLPQIASERQDFASVKFEFETSGDVVLSGDVPSDGAGQLLAAILRMEPGVRSVRNDLKIAPTPSAASK